MELDIKDEMDDLAFGGEVSDQGTSEGSSLFVADSWNPEIMIKEEVTAEDPPNSETDQLDQISPPRPKKIKHETPQSSEGPAVVTALLKKWNLCDESIHAIVEKGKFTSLLHIRVLTSAFLEKLGVPIADQALFEFHWKRWDKSDNTTTREEGAPIPAHRLPPRPSPRPGKKVTSVNEWERPPHHRSAASSLDHGPSPRPSPSPFWSNEAGVHPSLNPRSSPAVLRTSKSMVREKLINVVFGHPAVWNKKDRNHHNNVTLRRCWAEIAEEMKIEEASAKIMWKKLRETFAKKLSSQPPPQSGDEGCKNAAVDWPHFNSLLFLKDQFTARTSGGHFEDSKVTETLITHPDVIFDDGSIMLGAGPPPIPSNVCEVQLGCSPSQTSLSSTLPKMKCASVEGRTGQNTDAIGEGLLKAEQGKAEHLKWKEEDRKGQQNTPLEQKDEDAAFFDSILPHVRTLSAADKLKFRIETLQRLTNINTNSPGALHPTGSPTFLKSQQPQPFGHSGNN